jgi:hypothetical protein
VSIAASPHCVTPLSRPSRVFQKRLHDFQEQPLTAEGGDGAMEHTGPGRLPEGMEALARQASALRDALERSEVNTQRMVAVLGSFDRCVSAVEASVHPAQVRPPPLFPVRSPW